MGPFRSGLMGGANRVGYQESGNTPGFTWGRPLKVSGSLQSLAFKFLQGFFAAKSRRFYDGIIPSH